MSNPIIDEVNIQLVKNTDSQEEKSINFTYVIIVVVIIAMLIAIGIVVYQLFFKPAPKPSISVKLDPDYSDDDETSLQSTIIKPKSKPQSPKTKSKPIETKPKTTKIKVKLIEPIEEEDETLSIEELNNIKENIPVSDYSDNKLFTINESETDEDEPEDGNESEQEDGTVSEQEDGTVSDDDHENEINDSMSMD